ncbi:MAG: peptidylprolyl isomerase [Gemmataceae bacterium]
MPLSPLRTRFRDAAFDGGRSDDAADTGPNEPDSKPEEKPNSPRRSTARVLSMARMDNDPDSAQTSFSILLGDAPHLDGKYTVFGELSFGWDIVEMLGQVPRRAASVVRLTVKEAYYIAPGETLPRQLKSRATSSSPQAKAAAEAQVEEWFDRNDLDGFLGCREGFRNYARPARGDRPAQYVFSSYLAPTRLRSLNLLGVLIAQWCCS